MEAAEGPVLMLPGKPRFESQLFGTQGKTMESLRPCFWWAVTTRQSREELTGKQGFRPQQSTGTTCLLPGEAGTSDGTHGHSSLAGEEITGLSRVAWACCPDCAVDEPVCPSSISPAADGDKSLDLI